MGRPGHCLSPQGLFYKIILGGDLLPVRASCQFSSGAWEAASPMVGSRCTTLVGFNGEALETITFLAILRPCHGNLWTAATFYHNL